MTDTEHFKAREFACQCGCGANGMQQEFIDRLELARRDCGFPFLVTSGYRCPAHDREVGGGDGRGPHTTGYAADIATPTAGHRFALLHVLLGMGFDRVGVDAVFVHVDMAEAVDAKRYVPRVAWFYKSTGGHA